MQDVIRTWMRFLTEGNGALGAVILTLGTCYLFAGWRFGRMANFTTYALAGLAAGVYAGQSGGEDFIYASVICTLSILICLVSGRYAGAVLAGGLGLVLAWWWLGAMQLPAATMYIAFALAFAGFAALGATNDRIVSIVVTSLVGAILMVSGLTAMAHESRGMALQLRGLASYRIFYPLLLTVATVSGIMLQMAAAKRQDSGNVV